MKVIKKSSESKIPHPFLEVSFHDTKGMSNHKVITKFIAQPGYTFLCDKKVVEILNNAPYCLLCRTKCG